MSWLTSIIFIQSPKGTLRFIASWNIKSTHTNIYFISFTKFLMRTLTNTQTGTHTHTMTIILDQYITLTPMGLPVALRTPRQSDTF